MVTDFFSGNVQIELMSAPIHSTSRNLQCPVRIFSVEITVLGNHLRLYPETEFQSKSVDSLCKCRKSTFDLLFIYFPVTKCAPVIISFAKPSIVQNKHIQADVPGFFCNMIQFVCIKIKIGSFPVVYEDWSWLFYVFAADQVVFCMHHDKCEKVFQILLRNMT